MIEKLSTRAGIFSIVIAIVVFVLLGAANGILGEFGTTIFHWLVKVGIQFIMASSWPWVIILLILLFGLVSVVVIWQHTNHILDTTNRIVDLDNWLQRLVPNLVSAKDLDEEMQRLMYQLLQLATAVFDDSVHRASVFLPDPDRKHLRMRYGYQIPPETMIRTVFDIEHGKADTMRGIAGEAFLDEDGLPQIVHVKHEKGKWKTDRESSYIFFERNRPFVPYRSCVCVPISAGTSLADRLGVICFDSQSPTIFDSAKTEDSELQKRLITLSARFTAALQIYKELQTSHQSQQQN